MLHWGLLAAAHRLPFLPIGAGLGSGVLEVNPSCARSARRTRTTRNWWPCCALRLDAALVHMNRADAAGNGQYLGPDPYFDDLFCLAAERAYVSCERIVPRLDGPAADPAARTGRWCTGSRRRRTAPTSPAASPTTAATRRSRSATRRPRADPERVAAVHADVPRKGRGRLPEGGPVNADPAHQGRRSAWWRAPRRGAATATTLASPMGLIPTLGARLARLTFAPDLLLTDGEAYLVDEDGQVEGWLPYAKVFTMLAASAQARDDGRRPRSTGTATRTSPASATGGGRRRSCSACAARRATR